MLETPLGGPGTIILLNCRVVHGSVVNRSSKARPLLLTVYSSADSFRYTAHPIPSSRSGEIVRGKAARFASFDTRPCAIPPDWSHGYVGAWSAQKKFEEDRKKALA